MNITFLNIWNGTQQKEYAQFLKDKSSSEDILCFQEVSSYYKEKISNRGGVLHVLEITKSILNTFACFHAVRQKTWGDIPETDAPLPWGLCSFIRLGVPVLEHREVFLLGHYDSGTSEDQLPVLLQAIKVMNPQTKKHLWVLNIHGYYAGTGVGKHDTEERISQSKRMLEVITHLEGDIVLGGDFNLNPDTESIKMLEEYGLRNLIKEYGIQSTRTNLYPEEKREKWPFADYVFVSQGVTVKSFKVDTDSDVSDHAPMFLQI